MRETRSSGSVEGVMSNRDPYSDYAADRIEPGSVLDGEELFWYAPVKRTRTSQKIINSSGRTPSSKRMWVVLNQAGNKCGRAMKMDPEAKNSPKYMRQRCRAICCVPEIPRTIMRTSPAAASRTTLPMKKFMPTGTPS